MAFGYSAGVPSAMLMAQRQSMRGQDSRWQPRGSTVNAIGDALTTMSAGLLSGRNWGEGIAQGFGAAAQQFGPSLREYRKQEKRTEFRNSIQELYGDSKDPGTQLALQGLQADDPQAMSLGLALSARAARVAKEGRLTENHRNKNLRILQARKIVEGLAGEGVSNLRSMLFRNPELQTVMKIAGEVRFGTGPGEDPDAVLFQGFHSLDERDTRTYQKYRADKLGLTPTPPKPSTGTEDGPGFVDQGLAWGGRAVAAVTGAFSGDDELAISDADQANLDDMTRALGLPTDTPRPGAVPIASRPVGISTAPGPGPVTGQELQGGPRFGFSPRSLGPGGQMPPLEMLRLTERPTYSELIAGDPTNLAPLSLDNLMMGDPFNPPGGAGGLAPGRPGSRSRTGGISSGLQGAQNLLGEGFDQSGIEALFNLFRQGQRGGR